MAHLKFICVLVLHYFIFSSLFPREEAYSMYNNVGKRIFKVNICYKMFCTQGRELECQTKDLFS